MTLPVNQTWDQTLECPLDVGNVNLLPLNLFLSCLKMVVVVFFNKGEIMSVVGTNDMKSLNIFM